MKEEILNIFAIRCILHRQHLVAKNLSDRLHQSLNLIISIINKIKCHSLNDCLFHQLFHENDEDYECLLLHTHVHWLSKGHCLKRFFELFDTIIEFLTTNKFDITFNVSIMKSDVAHLADKYEKLNEVLQKLQGNNMNLIKAKSSIMSFINKLSLYKINLSHKDLSLFPH